MYKIMTAKKEIAQETNKERALTIFKTAAQDFRVLFLTKNDKVILYQGVPKKRQQKIGSELRGPKAKKLKEKDLGSIFNLEGL